VVEGGGWGWRVEGGGAERLKRRSHEGKKKTYMNSGGKLLRSKNFERCRFHP
jgi:hypothetical protein